MDTALITAFLKSHGIEPADFEKTGLEFNTLLRIRDEYKTRLKEYNDAGLNVVTQLLTFGIVHALKYRIKDPDHLISKIIRSKLKDPTWGITAHNFDEMITDIIGIRIIHLFKSHWFKVHEILNAHFSQLERPVANIRAGDPKEFVEDFSRNGCTVVVHPAGYRSVHYLIEAQSRNCKYPAEVQVRTIFEEGWGEIDHAVRYPGLSNPLIAEFLQILNRLAGSADEMGECVMRLKKEIVRRSTISEEVTAGIERLVAYIDQTPLADSEKEHILHDLSHLRDVYLPSQRRIGL